jgi:hypothetical protein
VAVGASSLVGHGHRLALLKVGIALEAAVLIERHAPECTAGRAQFPRDENQTSAASAWHELRVASPPSRRDDQTGSSVAFVEKLAEVAGVTVEIEAGDVVIGGTRVSIEGTPRDEMRRLLRVRRSRKRSATVEDLRQIALALPGAWEKTVLRRDGRTVVSFEVAKTMFVKLFEAGNLLAPDLDDVVLIRRVPDRAALLATTPERFFITRHYGDPTVVGPILTRLSENTVADLPELRELFEESWVRCAPKKLVASRSR